MWIVNWEVGGAISKVISKNWKWKYANKEINLQKIVCLFISSFIYLPTYLFICLFIYLFIREFFHVLMYSFILFSYLFIDQFIYLFIFNSTIQKLQVYFMVKNTVWSFSKVKGIYSEVNFDDIVSYYFKYLLVQFSHLKINLIFNHNG